MNFKIKTNTQKEKLSAIILLSKLTGANISDFYLDDDGEVSHNMNMRHPYLYISDNEITASMSPFGDNQYDYSTQLHEIIDLLTNPKKEYVVKDVGDYSATISGNGIEVGCQTISLEKFDEIAEKVALVRKSLQ
jgi:hypothetical protein